MKFLYIILTLNFSNTVFAVSQKSHNQAIQTWKTQNFEIKYKSAQTTENEVQIVGKKAEAFYHRLEYYLGQKLKNRLVISLEGNRGDDPKHRWAYVDDTAGWIHLFRFPEETFSYQTGLSHELVHAYRFEHLKSIESPSPAFVFLEEGIAEHLSNIIEPKKRAFSTYGYDLDVIGGQWIEANEDIPLETLLKDQYRLRPLCIPQSYTIQASFIQFLERTFGKEIILRLAYAKDIYDEKSFEHYLGDTFSFWAFQWKVTTLEQFRKIPHHIELGRQWRTQTPIADLKVCKKGIEF